MHCDNHHHLGGTLGIYVLFVELYLDYLFLNIKTKINFQEKLYF